MNAPEDADIKPKFSDISRLTRGWGFESSRSCQKWKLKEALGASRGSLVLGFCRHFADILIELVKCDVGILVIS